MEDSPRAIDTNVVIATEVAARLVGRSTEAIRALIRRGKLKEGEVVLGAGTRNPQIYKGVNLQSLVDYAGWRPDTVDEALSGWDTNIDRLNAFGGATFIDVSNLWSLESITSVASAEPSHGSDS